MPSQEEFDGRYWNRAPLLVRNGTRRWPARRWSKRRLRDQLGERIWAQWLRSHDLHASANIGRYFESNSTHAAQRSRITLSGFLCNDSCKEPTADGDQSYLFDRDDWLEAVPELVADVTPPPQISSHYDERWHERWSMYLLVSALGSGINFHRVRARRPMASPRDCTARFMMAQETRFRPPCAVPPRPQHTNAFNGLLVGRKRWFLYPPQVDPPSPTRGMLSWYSHVYRAHWAAPEGQPAGVDGLQQCMQEQGDLLYVPQHWWHATLALGEGLGISGQFVRRLPHILARVNVAVREGRHTDALAELEFVLEHREEVEGPVAVAVASDAAVLRAKALGDVEGAERAARVALQIHAQLGVGDPHKAKSVLAWVTREREARVGERIKAGG